MSQFTKGDFVKVYGSWDLIWEVINLRSDEEHDYLYTLKLIEGNFPKERLTWIPECLIRKTDYSLEIEDNEETPLL